MHALESQGQGGRHVASHPLPSIRNPKSAIRNFYSPAIRLTSTRG